MMRGEDKALVKTAPPGEEESGVQEYSGGGGGEPVADENRDDLPDQLLRLRAEFENFRRRSSREQADADARAARLLVVKLLPLLDVFEEALRAPAPGEAAAYREGFTQIHGQFLGLLESEGLEEVPGVGSAFDPELHDAVAEAEAADVEPGRIAEVVRKGYKLNGHLLRPALVRVAGPSPDYS